MNTYEALKQGQLSGTVKLALSCELETFPEEILTLSDTLEILDLSRNRLSSLPEAFGQLKKLRILFLSENLFTELPEVLSLCESLTMIGFKSNQIDRIPENALPPKVRWLILTDNKISALPGSIGELPELQKLMLAGNAIRTLPASMANCQKLELIRLSANQLQTLPSWLFTLPKLSWLACAGNPCMKLSLPDTHTLAEIAWEEVSLMEELGEGASGVISKVRIGDDAFAAVKLFKGEMTSDGLPEDEMAASMKAGKHPNLTLPYGKVTAHPEEKEGLLFPLIPPVYANLGNPPSLESCTRDVYDKEASFSYPLLLRIISDVASAALHLHQHHVNHGDLYAHNILIDKEGHTLLGDFGAATAYDHNIYKDQFERLEVRAFGCLLEELLEHCTVQEEDQFSKIQKLTLLKNNCMTPAVTQRPDFQEITTYLHQL